MKRVCLIACVVMCVFIAGCGKGDGCDCFKPTGKFVTEQREISGFTKLVVEDKINVFITEDSVYSVVVECGKNLLKKIMTELSGETLRIWNSNNCNFMRSYKYPVNVYIHMPKVLIIEHLGSGMIRSTNTLNADTLEVFASDAGDLDLKINTVKFLTHMHATADITVSGQTGEHSCYALGYGFLHAESLQTNYTWIYSNTMGDMKVRVSGVLDVKLRSAGNVYYSGNPGVLIQDITGIGKLLTY